MAKATIKLSSGAIVNMEGTVEEIHQLLNFYDKKAVAQEKPKHLLSFDIKMSGVGSL